MPRTTTANVAEGMATIRRHSDYAVAFESSVLSTPTLYARLVDESPIDPYQAAGFVEGGLFFEDIQPDW